MSNYINELASAADIAQYKLTALCQHYTCSTLQIQWTVDKAQGSFLMEVRNNHEDPAVSLFVFHWHEQRTEELLRLEFVESADDRLHVRWHLLSSASKGMDEGASSARLAALKDALMAYKTDGLDSDDEISHVVEFDF
jgi:hypothetical protein